MYIIVYIVYIVYMYMIQHRFCFRPSRGWVGMRRVDCDAHVNGIFLFREPALSYITVSLGVGRALRGFQAWY